MKLLNEEPYITIELTREDKERLVNTNELNPDGESYYDLEEQWFITNDPNLDDVWDGRDTDFWNKGREYPFPYSLLIGGNTVNHHYDSYSYDFIKRNNLLKYFEKK